MLSQHALKSQSVHGFLPGFSFVYSRSLPDVKMFGWFGLGAILLRGAGCNVNDVLDNDIDGKDKEDDLKVGVKSTALRFGDETKPWLIGFSTGCVTSLTFAGFNCGVGWPFYVGAAAAAGHLAGLVSAVDIQNRLFVSNKWYPAIVLGKLVESSF